MYDKALVSGGGALVALPMTGFGAVWLVIAGFALTMAGGALLRILPRGSA